MQSNSALCRGPHRRGVRRPGAASASMADINLIIGRTDGGSRLWLSKTVSAISWRITSNRCANSGERASAHSTAPASLRLNVPAANQGRSNSSSTTPRTPPSVIIMADPARPQAARAAPDRVHVLRKSVAPDPRSPPGLCPITFQFGRQPQTVVALKRVLVQALMESRDWALKNGPWRPDASAVQHYLIRAHGRQLDLIAGQTKGFDRWALIC